VKLEQPFLRKVSLRSLTIIDPNSGHTQRLSEKDAFVHGVGVAHVGREHGEDGKWRNTKYRTLHEFAEECLGFSGTIHARSMRVVRWLKDRGLLEVVRGKAARPKMSQRELRRMTKSVDRFVEAIQSWWGNLKPTVREIILAALENPGGQEMDFSRWTPLSGGSWAEPLLEGGGAEAPPPPPR
jgi:hypothetical protein